MEDGSMVSWVGVAILAVGLFIGGGLPLIALGLILVIGGYAVKGKTKVTDNLGDLEKFKELRDKGTITEQEYQTKRKQILNI